MTLTALIGSLCARLLFASPLFLRDPRYALRYSIIIVWYALRALRSVCVGKTYIIMGWVAFGEPEKR